MPVKPGTEKRYTFLSGDELCSPPMLDFDLIQCIALGSISMDHLLNTYVIYNPKTYLMTDCGYLNLQSSVIRAKVHDDCFFLSLKYIITAFLKSHFS